MVGSEQAETRIKKAVCARTKERVVFGHGMADNFRLMLV